MEQVLLHKLKRQLYNINVHEVVLSLVMGLMIGVLTVFIMISFASLIFSGDLSGYINQGIGFTLFGGKVFSFVIALTSSLKGAIAVPQDTIVSVLAIMAASLSASMMNTASLETIATTVIALIVTTTLLTGIILYIIGFFKLGNLMRFIPYPVIGGFLTGSGLLLVRGSIGVMTDVNFKISQIPLFLQPGILFMWLPGVIFAVVLLLLLRKYNNFFILPAMILGGILVFYGVLLIFKIPVIEAMDKGWLLGPFSNGSFWYPVNFKNFSIVNWTAARGQIGNIIR